MSDDAANDYTASTYCRNCGTEGVLTAPKGTAVSDVPCPTCGIEALCLDLDERHGSTPWTSSTGARVRYVAD